MKTKLYAISLAALSLALAGGPLAAGEFRIDLADAGTDGRLSIMGLNGDIDIQAGDETAIVVQSDDLGGEEPRPVPPGMRSLLTTGTDNSGLGFEIKRDGKDVTLVPARPHQEADITLRMPRTMSLKIVGVLRGDVGVTGLGGEIEVQVTEGDIDLHAVSGPVVVQSVNGDVTVEFARLPAQAPSAINAVNGAVTLRFPPTAAATLDLRTINGDILSDLPIEVTEREMMFHPGGPRSVKGTLNGGGVSLKASSINDNIVLGANTGATQAEGE